MAAVPSLFVMKGEISQDALGSAMSSMAMDSLRFSPPDNPLIMGFPTLVLRAFSRLSCAMMRSTRAFFSARVLERGERT